MAEVGTLGDLGLEPGDIVECVTCPEFGGEWTCGKQYEMTNRGLTCDRNPPQMSSVSKFRIVSRANKLWRDMTPEEKGALLLAEHEGKVIENRNETVEWGVVAYPAWYDDVSYRIKPEPKVEAVTIANFHESARGHRITFNLIDGKPDCASVKMEEL